MYPLSLIVVTSHSSSYLIFPTPSFPPPSGKQCLPSSRSHRCCRLRLRAQVHVGCFFTSQRRPLVRSPCRIIRISVINLTAPPLHFLCGCRYVMACDCAADVVKWVTQVTVQKVIKHISKIVQQLQMHLKFLCTNCKQTQAIKVRDSFNPDGATSLPRRYVKWRQLCCCFCCCCCYCS
jgi:hypothetical protein